jgi:hypothetical protein
MSVAAFEPLILIDDVSNGDFVDGVTFRRIHSTSQSCFVTENDKAILATANEHMEKFTVIIPTRDRAVTLGPTLRTCLRQSYANYEIIVSDNMSDDNTREIVATFGDPRIRYINPGRRLSMAGNFEFALQHVPEGFVMFIGADDGLMPDAISYVEQLARQHQVLAVSCRQATYGWPNFPDPAMAGRFLFSYATRHTEIRQSDEWTRHSLRFAAHYCFDLPNLYCGFVHRSVIDKAMLGGIYFRSRTPDAYSALASALFLDRYAFSHIPFVIAGASPSSTGWSQLHRVGSDKESKKFESENDIELADGFVSCPSFQVILGEAFEKLSAAFTEQCSRYQLDYDAMLGLSIQDANERTRNKVKAAVQQMATHFGVDLTRAAAMPRPQLPPTTQPDRKRRKMPRVLRKLLKREAAADASAADLIIDTKVLGANNIDEAILTCQILRMAGNNSVSASLWSTDARLTDVVKKLSL